MAEQINSEAVATTVETPAAPAVEEKTVEAPAEQTETPAPTAEATQELYELPDGRKVDGQTLAKEWKENFLPDYTRKAQRLAAIEKPKPTEAPDAEPWRDPNWQPQTYAELIEAAKTELERDQIRKQEEEANRLAAADTFVQGQLDEIKKDEPNLSEQLLFQHAVKYHFTDLRAAFQNMKDMNKAVKMTEQRVIENMKSREADPISGRPGAGTAPEGGIDYNSDRRNTSAVEYLKSIKH